MTRLPERVGFDGETHRTLCFWLARGLTLGAAAKKADIPCSARLSNALKTTQHAEMLRQAIDDCLETELAPLAIKTLGTILKDEKQPGRVRVDAAKTILDRSGHVPYSSRKQASGAGELTEMTQDELRSFIERGEAELAARAKEVVPVDG